MTERDRSIGEVASAAGVAASAVRYYERIGLLPPARRVNGRRRYGSKAVGRLALIKVAKEIGFSLAEIRVLVEGIAKGDRSPRRLQALAKTKIPEVEAVIRRAQLVKRVLKAAERCECPSLDDCVKAVQRTGDLARV